VFLIFVSFCVNFLIVVLVVSFTQLPYCYVRIFLRLGAHTGFELWELSNGGDWDEYLPPRWERLGV